MGPHAGASLFPDLTSDDIFRLETKRLWLRWPRTSDIRQITSFASLAATAQMTAAIPHPYPAGEAERFVFKSRADNANGKALVLAITQKRAVGHAIGLISATQSDRGNMELGYMLVPAVWGNGIASEAATAVIDAIFVLTSTSSLLANSRVINGASRRVLEKCGFAYIDTGLDVLPARGGLHPCDRFRLDRRAWARNRGGKSMPPMMHQAFDPFGAAAIETRLPL